jgi:hypothetical protein
MAKLIQHVVIGALLGLFVARVLMSVLVPLLGAPQPVAWLIALVSTAGGVHWMTRPKRT